MKRVLSAVQVSMLIVAGVVGAGFASGKEILMFFGRFYRYKLATALVLWVLFSLVSYLFLRLGAYLKPKDLSVVHKHCFSKLSWTADLLVLFNCVVVGGGMLAGANSVGRMLFPELNYPLLAIVFSVLIFFILLKGAKGLLASSTVLAPVILLFLIAFCAFGIANGTDGADGGGISIALPVNIVVYVCMNLLLAGGTISTVGIEDKKTILPGAIAGGGIIALLVYLMLWALCSNGITEGEMPVLILIKRFAPPLYISFAVVLLLAIFTTLLSAVYSVSLWAESVFKSKALSAGAVLVVCYLVSLAGFSAIVEYLYPVFGALGVLYIAVTAARSFRLRNAPQSMPRQKRERGKRRFSPLKNALM